jgi:hypothetical protein
VQPTLTVPVKPFCGVMVKLTRFPPGFLIVIVLAGAVIVKPGVLAAFAGSQQRKKNPSARIALNRRSRIFFMASPFGAEEVWSLALF